MAIKRLAKPERPAKPKAGTPNSAKSKRVSKKLTPEQRELLEAIRNAPEPEQFDLLMGSDRNLVRSLVEQGEIVFPKHTPLPKRMTSLPGATFTRAQIREAFQAIRREREQAAEKALE
jgi:hypothetical protein